MMFKTTEVKYSPHPVLERALDVLFILHADHEQNCSTSAMRGVGSSHPDPYSCMAAAAAALYGPLHGGANEEVLKMLREIGSIDAIPAYILRVKKGEVRLMGFGHRVYKNFDPRAKIIKHIADQVFDVTGKNPLIDIALEIEKYGAKVTAQYAVLGPYDFVSIVDCPDNETIARVSVELASRGSIRLMTLAATPVANFVRSLKPEGK